MLAAVGAAGAGAARLPDCTGGISLPSPVASEQSSPTKSKMSRTASSLTEAGKLNAQPRYPVPGSSASSGGTAEKIANFAAPAEIGHFAQHEQRFTAIAHGRGVGPQAQGPAFFGRGRFRFTGRIGDLA